MNYDPTLRNIKAKYLYKEDTIEGMKHAETQVEKARDQQYHMVKISISGKHVINKATWVEKSRG